MFDTLQAFLRLVGDFRSVDKDVVKMCANSLSMVGCWPNGQVQCCIFVYRRLDGGFWVQRVSVSYIRGISPLITVAGHVVYGGNLRSNYQDI
jgi:hypothetical protein